MTPKPNKALSPKKRSSKGKTGAPPISKSLLQKVKQIEKAARQGRRQRLRHNKLNSEAQLLYEHTVWNEEFGGALIARFTCNIPTAFRSTAIDDYQMIASALASGDTETNGGPYNGPQHRVWERFAHHFQDSEKRYDFFAAIDDRAKRFQQDMIFCQAHAALHCKQADPPDLLWDDTLLPAETAPHILRQWTRDRATTERFLIALFDHFARFRAKGSIGRRGLILADTVPQHRWKPQLMVQKLEETGDVFIGKHDNKADRKLSLDQQAGTVGRSVIRMRSTARKWAEKGRTRRPLFATYKPEPPKEGGT